MKRPLYTILFFIAVFTPALNANEIPVTYRIWNYDGINVGLSKRTGFIFITGTNYEYIRYVNNAKTNPKGFLVYEFSAASITGQI